MLSHTEARERVARGAAYLDRHVPGWVDIIDLSQLNLSSQCGCVLGQLEGDFSLAIEKLKPWWTNLGVLGRWAEQRGFYLHPRLTEVWKRDYETLTISWREHIIARRPAVPVQWTHREPVDTRA
jgi:hypothetical protein